jgi:hypothetical protein
MEAYTEIRWHGRAQQGIVTAAKVLGETALREGKFVQAFPEFGPERMGAPVKAFNRVSEKPIKLHCQVTSPRIVLIADPTLIGMTLAGGIETSGGVTDGAIEEAVFIVNTRCIYSQYPEVAGGHEKGTRYQEPPGEDLYRGRLRDFDGYHWKAYAEYPHARGAFKGNLHCKAKLTGGELPRGQCRGHEQRF